MSLLFDTNILMFLVRNGYHQQIWEILNPDNQKVYISVVTIAELKSISLKNNWGVKKAEVVTKILDKMIMIEVNENLINLYAEIDSFSQCKNPSYPDRTFATPRNMGKNDLWIASTAALLGLKLMTTDNDFNHLHQAFIEVQNIKPGIFKG